MILKNVASQGVYLFAYNKTTGVGLAGDQANITGSVSKDGGAEAAFTTTNPTNIGGGIYWQPLSQAETNADAVAFRWVSSTSNIVIDPVIGFTERGRIDAAISTRLATASYTAPLDAAGVRTAVGLASANLDTQIDGLPTVAEFEARTLPIADYFDPSTDAVTVGTNTDKTGYSLSTAPPTATEVADAVVNAFGVTGSVNDGSATATSFVGNSELSSSDDFYGNSGGGSVLQFTSGALKGIARVITGYTGATRTFTFTEAFPTAPANTDEFVILGRID